MTAIDCCWQYFILKVVTLQKIFWGNKWKKKRKRTFLASSIWHRLKVEFIFFYVVFMRTIEYVTCHIMATNTLYIYIYICLFAYLLLNKCDSLGYIKIFSSWYLQWKHFILLKAEYLRCVSIVEANNNRIAAIFIWILHWKNSTLMIAQLWSYYWRLLWLVNSLLRRKIHLRTL